MAADTRELTINIRDFSDRIPSELEVSMTLTGADEAIPTTSEPGRQIIPITIPGAVSSTSGDVMFNLIPTARLKRGNRYRVSWPGYEVIFDMPDMDTTLYDILATSMFTPTRPPLPPAGLADGTYSVIRNNVWTDDRPIFVATTAPPSPFTNATLWIDTTTDPAVLKYFDGTAWQEVGGGSSGGLNQNAVDARIADRVEDFAEVGNAATIPTAKIADGAINNLKLQDAIIDNDKIQDDGIGLGKIASAAGPDIRDALDDLSGTDRLDAGAIKNLPTRTTGGLTEHTITVGTDTGLNEFYGFREDTGGIGAFGSANNADIEFGSTDETLRAIYQGENGGIVFITTPGIAATGEDSQEDLAIEIDGFEIYLSDMARTAVTVNSVAAIQYRIVDTTARIPRTVGQTFTFRVRGPIETRLDRLADSTIDDDEVENFAKVGNAATIPSAKIANNAITAPKIAASAVSAGKIATSSGPDIRNALAALTGSNRLDATAVKNLPTGGTGSGLNQQQVDSRIDSLIEDWAYIARNSRIPSSKISGIAADAAADRPFIGQNTITIGRDGDGTNYGFDFNGGYGGKDAGTFRLIGGTQLSLERLSQVGTGLVTWQPAFIDLPATGTESVADLYLELGGVFYKVSEMTTTDRTTFTFMAPTTAIFTQTVGDTIIVRVVGPETAFKELKDEVEALPATAVPQPVADTGSVGTGDRLALETHVHATDRLTEAQVDERISALASNRDVIATSTFTREATTGGGVGVNNLALTFTPESGTAITIGRISQDTTSRYITITTTPLNSRASVVGYKIAIGDDIVLSFEEASYSLGDDPPGPGINPDGYLWETGHAAFPSGNISVEIFEPLDEDNYVPGGGTDGQILGHSDGRPAWEDKVDGEVYEAVGTASLTSGSYRSGTVQQLTLASTSVDTGSGMSISNNRINIAAGTEERVYLAKISAEIDPTGHLNSATSGGNRLFADIFGMKNGVEIPGTRKGVYQRADERYTPLVWYAQLSFGVVLTGGDYITFHLERKGTYVAGSEIDTYQINAANSDVSVITQSPGTGGASGGGGPSGQADTSRTLYVSQWKRSAAKPAVSELSPSDWDNAGWITTGTGWFDRPDLATGTDPLWHAITTATYDGSNWTLATWSIHVADSYSVRYFDTGDGSGASTSTPTASSRSFQRRDPDTGQWGVVVPFGDEILYWKWFVNTTMSGITSSSSVKVVTFPTPLDLSAVSDIYISVQLRSGSQIVLYDGDFLVPRSPFAVASALDTLVQPNERVNIRASVEDGVKVLMGSTAIGNHGSGSVTNFECDFFFRQTADTADGALVAKDIRFYRFGSWNQNVTIQMFYR